MTRLIWKQSDVQLGLNQGVLYLKDKSLAWNGLVSVTENSLDNAINTYYIDGAPYLHEVVPETFGATIVAYTYPEEFDPSHEFGFSYKTYFDSDAYLIHLVYNLSGSDAIVTYNTINESVDPFQYSWDVEALPVHIFEQRPAAHLIIDSRKTYPWLLSQLDYILYGSEVADPRLPPMSEILGLFEDASIVKVTDHGDGTFDIEGPDDIVYFTDTDAWEVDYSTAKYLDPITYTIHSL